MRYPLIRRACLSAAAVALVILLPATLMAQKGELGPTNVTVVSNGTSANVSWTPVSSRGVTYRVLRAPDARQRGVDLTDPIDGATFEDAKVESGATYFYQVVALYADGTVAAAAPVGFTLPSAVPVELVPVPMPPPKSKIAAPPPAQVSVTGTPALTHVTWGLVGASSYSVQRWMPSVPDCCRASSPQLAATDTEWDDPVPWAGTYVYRVTAFYADGRQGFVDVSYTRPEPTNPGAVTPQHWVTYQVPPGSFPSIGTTSVIRSIDWAVTVNVAWSKVPGASYYIVWGPGLPNTGKQLNTTVNKGVETHQTIVSVNNGSGQVFRWGVNTWTVAAFFLPGPVSTAAANFTKISLTIPKKSPPNR